MRTNEQIAEELCTYYKAYRRAEEVKKNKWLALYKKWEKDNYADRELGDQVEAAQKEHAEIEEKTNAIARLALDYILKDERAEDEQ